MTSVAHAAPCRAASAPVSLRELSGTIIDARYAVRRLLAYGGMGVVYEAVQLQRDRRVAIKILNPDFMHRDDYVARFMREVKVASRIRHANVVQMLGFGTLANGSVYSVMELLEGRDLAHLLRQQTKLPWGRTRELLLQIISGVNAAHAVGVIHRDIKPSNLFLACDADEGREVLKVLDFGVARLMSSANETAVTGTADLVGTPAYMAPELARGRSADPRTEVYSIGVVAYRMLTGRMPHCGDSAFDALFRAAIEKTPTLRSHEPTVPREVDALVLRMLAKDPLDRPADMSALYREVAAIEPHPRVRSGPPVVTGGYPTLHHGPATRSATFSSLGGRRVVSSRAARTATRRFLVPAIVTVTLAGFVASAATSGTPDTRAEAPAGVRPMIAASVVPPPDAAIATMARVPPAALVEIDAPPTEMYPGVDVVIVDDDDDDARSRPRPRATKAALRTDDTATDTEALRRIQKQAKRRCGALLGGEPLRVTFGIGHSGEVLTPRGSHGGPATDCVIGILGTARFAHGSMRKQVLAL